jgi:hypothetical protein
MPALARPDLAMYAAKADGRRTYRFFEPSMDARAKAHRAVELDLRKAIADGGFEFHYQPVVIVPRNAPPANSRGTRRKITEVTVACSVCDQSFLPGSPLLFNSVTSSAITARVCARKRTTIRATGRLRE